MVNRIVSVDEAFAFPPEVRAALLDLLGAGSPGRPLASVTHSPATQAEYATADASTFVALAPANLAATFVAPASGGVLVDVEGHINTCAGRGYWGALIAGTVHSPAVVCGVTVEGDARRVSARLPVSGLTPGQAYDVQWAATSSTGQMKLRAGGAGFGTASSGPATLTVWAAP